MRQLGKRMIQRKKLMRLLRIVISSSILIYLFQKIELQEFDFLMPGIVSLQFLNCCIFLVAGIHVSAIAQYRLIQANGEVLEKRSFSSAFYQSMIVGMILPGRIGDFSLAAMITKSIPASRTVSFVLADKIMSVMGFLLAGIFFTLIYGYTSWAGFALLLLFCSLIAYSILQRLASNNGTAPKNRLINWALQRFLDINQFTMRSLVQNGAFKILRLFFFTTSIYFMIQAFGSYIEFARVMFGVTTVHLSSLLPISFQGIGVTEMIYYKIFSDYDISLAVIIAFSMMIRLLMMLITGVLFLIFEYLTNILDTTN